jgi:hypothetical protein
MAAIAPRNTAAYMELGVWVQAHPADIGYYRTFYQPQILERQTAHDWVSHGAGV